MDNQLQVTMTLISSKEGFFLMTAAIAWFGYFSYETAYLRRTE